MPDKCAEAERPAYTMSTR